MLRIQTTGNLGKDAIVNDVNGVKAINFSVASTERYKDANGNVKDVTTWLECTIWRKSAEIAKHLKKGTKVLIEGKPEAKYFASEKQEGTSINAFLHINVSNLEFLSPAKKEGDDSDLPEDVAENLHF